MHCSCTWKKASITQPPRIPIPHLLHQSGPDDVDAKCSYVLTASCARNCVFPHLPTHMLLRSTVSAADPNPNRASLCFTSLRCPRQMVMVSDGPEGEKQGTQGKGPSSGPIVTHCFPRWLFRHTPALICTLAKEENEAWNGKSNKTQSAKTNQRQEGGTSQDNLHCACLVLQPMSSTGLACSTARISIILTVWHGRQKPGKHLGHNFHHANTSWRILPFANTPNAGVAFDPGGAKRTRQ